MDIKKYEDEQYFEKADSRLATGFTNLERLLLELNYKNYYPDDNQNAQNHTSKALTYERILNECGLDPYATYDKNTDHVKLLEAAYTILHTLLGNIDVYRKIETEFATQGEAFTNLTNRLKDLRAEINKVKAEMHYQDSDFTFMYYTR